MQLYVVSQVDVSSGRQQQGEQDPGPQCVIEPDNRLDRQGHEEDESIDLQHEEADDDVEEEGYESDGKVRECQQELQEVHDQGQETDDQVQMEHGPHV